jgi:hypothetical protein
MSNAKVRYRRRKRVEQAQAWARESLRWAPMTPGQNRAFWKLLNFGAGFFGGMRPIACGLVTQASARKLLQDWKVPA